nr:immunoglobulin light chain junction region [Macaca mulatta]MOX71156.1 immunoglobulin light chain junction region [Macaca mulatta]MOX73149.1 immunoglobulin light chain junction region [Macaca mulatta]MOX74402.1 immunoglobulin light chain junction region [Macaca mulatta]MOX74936.1 immunoglobulin light chain junction region [Macaca mulatta]
DYYCLSYDVRLSSYIF